MNDYNFRHTENLILTAKRDNAIDQAELFSRTAMYRQLSIQEVSDQLELPKSTIRYWEKELAEHIQPMRTQGGQRRYDIGHIAVFARVRELKNEGLTLRQIKHSLSHTHDQEQMTDARYAAFDSLAERIADIVRHELRHLIRGGKP